MRFNKLVVAFLAAALFLMLMLTAMAWYQFFALTASGNEVIFTVVLLSMVTATILIIRARR
jgi:hypothetical protein